MKKYTNFLASLFATFTLTAALAQASGIRFELVNTPGVEQNGVTLYAADGTESPGLYLTARNVSGTSQEYKWERVRMSLSNPAAEDQLCDNWQCYTLHFLGDNWILGNPISLANDASTIFEPKIMFPEGTTGTATYRYYVRDSNDERIDSITVVFTSTLSIEEDKISVSDSKVYPNPSTGIITVKDAPAGSDIEITDMVGKVVFKAKLNGTTQNFDLSKNPDGIYFYTIRAADGQSVITKRIVLRK
jgi:hypothetical protein